LAYNKLHDQAYNGQPYNQRTYGGTVRQSLMVCTSALLISAMLSPLPALANGYRGSSIGPMPDGASLDGASLGGGWSRAGIGRLHDPYAEPVGDRQTMVQDDAMVAHAPSEAIAHNMPVAPEPVVAPVDTDEAEHAWVAAPIAMVAMAEPVAGEAQDADSGISQDQDEAVVAQAPAEAVAHAEVDPNEPPKGAIESLRKAIVAALKQNPEIQIALARQDDARYGIHEAWAGYLPQVDMTVGIGRERNDPYNPSGSLSNRTTLTRKEATVTLNQNVWDFGTTINDIKRARAAYKSAQWATRERIEAIAYDISAAYLNVLERQKLVELTDQEIAANEKILNMVTIQEDLGLTTPADVNRAKARLDNVKSERLDRTSSLKQAREAYRRLTRHLPAQTVDLPSTTRALPVTAQQAVMMIDDHNPRMAQAVQNRRSIERQRASQTGTFFPKIGLSAQGNWKDNVQGATNFANDARAMVTVTYSFFNGGRDIALRNRLSARLREADYEVDRRRREVEQDIRIDFNALEAAREKISSIESEIVAADRVAELYRQQFREGRRSVFDLLDSQQILFDAKAKQLTNGTAKMLAEFRVLQRLGSLFDHVSEGEDLPDITTPAPGISN